MNGFEFENAVVKELFNNGWWALRIPPNTSGAQPFDILAIKEWLGGYSYPRVLAIDCKVCKNKKFPISRIEDNQWLAFESLKKRGGKLVEMGFVILHDDICYFLPYDGAVLFRDNGLKTIDYITEGNKYLWNLICGG